MCTAFSTSLELFTECFLKIKVVAIVFRFQVIVSNLASFYRGGTSQTKTIEGVNNLAFTKIIC